MASKIEIYKMACIEMGADLVNSLTEDSKEVRALNAAWAMCLKGMLQAHDWNFAQKRVALALLTTEPAFQWEYAYTIPTDCVRPVRLGDSESELDDDSGYEFKVEIMVIGSTNTKVIMSNLEDA